DLEVGEDSTGGIDSLLLRSDAEREASESVAVVVADNWAVRGEDEDEIDMTIDASNVSADGYVLINASQESSANLSIIGAKSAGNILLGGAGRDTLKGGDGFDILQ